MAVNRHISAMHFENSTDMACLTIFRLIGLLIERTLFG